MAPWSNDQLLLEMAVSRGHLTESDLVSVVDLAHSASASAEIPVSARWGPRIDTLIARGRLSVAVVEQLRDEIQQTAAALTLARPTPPRTAATSTSSIFPVANWDKYQFLSTLGQGGMGVVFKARDRKLGRVVALKFLSGTDPVQTQRFLQEARAQAQLDHPNICKIYETGEVQGKPYIVMHFIDGLSFDAARQSLSLPEKVRLLREAAEAVHVAHSHDIIHRDIKPSNIMIENTSDGGTRAVLMDFGLARTAGHALTMTGEVLGTPAYMSPEQARGDTRSLDGRTDVYSLGASLFEILAGSPPFQDASVYDLLIKLNDQEPPLLRSRDPSLPEALETIVAKCLQKDPARRYLTAQALADDLSRFLFEKRISARKEPLWSRLLYRAKRNKPVTALGLGLLGTILILAFYGSWSRVQAQRNQEKARREALAQAALAERLGQEIKDMEWLLRSARQLPLHDLRPEKALVRARMAALRDKLDSSGTANRALSHYALGRGFLALHEYPQALAELQAAIAAGNQRAEVYASLGVALGKHYEQAIYEARLSGGGPWAQKQLQTIAPKYLEPAIAALERSRTMNHEEPAYLQALIAYYQRKDEVALRYAKEAQRQAPWLYEASLLAGDVYLHRALEQRDRGGMTDEALTGFQRAAEKYEVAASIGRSDAQVYEGLAEARLRIMESKSARGAGNATLFSQALEASQQISIADPDSASGPLKVATTYSRSRGIDSLTNADRIDRCYRAGREALTRQPENPYAADVTANCLMERWGEEIRLGKNPEATIAEAIALLKAALRVHPNFLWGRNDLGLFMKGKIPDALARDPVLAKRILLEQVSPLYQANLELDPDYIVSYVNVLDVMDGLALLPLSAEEESRLLVQSDEFLAACLHRTKTEFQCYNNYAILRTLLGWRAFQKGLPAEPLLLSARAEWSAMATFGASFLDAQQYLSLNHLVEAMSRMRKQEDPTPALGKFQESVTGCFRIAQGDAFCRSLLVRKMWVEAEQRSGSSRARLQAALAEALSIVKENPTFPDGWWVLAETRLRLSSARSPGRESEVNSGLTAVEKLLSLYPAHVLGRITQGRLELLRAQMARTPALRQAAAERALSAFDRSLSIDSALLPAFRHDREQARSFLSLTHSVRGTRT